MCAVCVCVCVCVCDREEEGGFAEEDGDEGQTLTRSINSACLVEGA